MSMGVLNLILASTRLSECVSLQHAREELGISPEEMYYFVGLHPCHRRAAIWLLPVGFIPWRLALRESWRLWPSQEWQEQVNEVGILNEPITVECCYLLHCQGRHPEIRRHALRIDFSVPGLAPLQCSSTLLLWLENLSWAGLPVGAGSLPRAGKTSSGTLAEAGSSPCISTFCDASKCFDNLPLEDVWALARHLGMPERVLGPLSQWQANQERRICYENWVSEKVRYDRGIVQGDPLSVSLCLLWGATWQNLLRNNLTASDFDALVYMDDFMFSVRDAYVLRKCLALTEWHFSTWRLILNLDKTAIVCNRCAKERFREELCDVQVRTEESQVYLGIEAGSEWRTTKAREREESAHRRLRRMRMLPLPQMGWKRVLPSFVGSLWYGMEFRPLSDSLRGWHCDIKSLAHGRARVSANWKLVQVFSLPAFSLLPECIHWSSSWSGVWRLANYEPTRTLLLVLWNSRVAPRNWGLWNSFVESVSRLGGRIRPGGGYPLGRC